jgi:DNA-binding response OmpR family regulator
MTATRTVVNTAPSRVRGPQDADAPVPTDWLLAPPRVLVVDDDEDCCELVATVAERCGFGVATAGDGLTALRLAMSCPLDLVVMDLVMPDIDGHEVCRRLLAGLVHDQVPVIMMTGDKAPDARLLSYANGAVAHLKKPVRPRVLASLMSDLL